MKVTLLHALLVINKGTCGAVCRMSLCWILGLSHLVRNQGQRGETPEA